MPRVSDPSLLAQLGGPASVPGGIVLRGADPTKAVDADIKRAELEQKRAQNNLAPVEARKAIAEAVKAEAEASAAGSKGGDPRSRQITDDLATDDLLGMINQARGQVGTFSTGTPSQILGKFGGTGARDLKGTLNTIGSRVTRDVLAELKSMSKTGASGFGALSEREGALLRDSVASLDQAQSEGQLRRSLDQVETHYRNVKAIMAGDDPRDKKVQQLYDIGGAPPAISGGSVPGGPPLSGGRVDKSTPAQGGGGGEGGMTLAQGNISTEPDPTLKGVNAHVNAMYKSGAPDDAIRGYLRDVGARADPASVNAALAFRRSHPSYRGDYPVSLENRDVPMSPLRSTVNAAAQSPFGAFATGVGDIASLGTLDNMTSNPALARAGMDQVAAEHPVASTLGGIVGGAGLGLGAESALGALGIPGGMALLAPRSLGADALVGGGYGAGSADDGNRGEGAALGGFGGMIGGVLGRGATGGAGRLLSGITNPDVRAMEAAGVSMTPGQLVGQSGRVGQSIKGIEDRLTGYPIVGENIKDARRDGLRDFNIAAFNEGPGLPGSPITDTGAGGMLQKRGQTQGLYGIALDNVSIPPDAQFATDLAAASQRGGAIPTLGPDFTHIMQNNLTPMAAGQSTLTGGNLQNMLRLIRNRRGAYGRMGESGSNPLGSDVADALGDVESSLIGLVNRQSPDTIPALNDANASYRNKKVLERAVLSAKNQPDEIFTPAQLNHASVMNNRGYGGSTAAAEGNRPFYYLATRAQRVLPSSVPDSGTAGRMALPMLLASLGGGAGAARGASDGSDATTAAEDGGFGAAGGLALAALLSAPYSRGGGSALRAALIRRPAVLRSLGMDIRNTSLPYGGALIPGSVPAAISYLPQDGR